MAPKTWFPELLRGTRVVLRRHTPGNLAAFRRWYADPEIARLARYQEAPMRADEIERFFAARVVGTDALAMAIHEASTDRLVGSCAFSQLDADNGSALYHITIGEKDAWGQGFGTEATQLMLDHAFGTLGLHRIALFVFEFNERAIRAYRRCGFVVEGRSRESIWRDGRWWDEMAMSVLESDWRQARVAGAEDGADRAALVGEAKAGEATEGRAETGEGSRAEVVAGPEANGLDRVDGDADQDAASGGAAATGILERTMRRWR